MGSVNDNIQAALSPIYGAKSTNHLIQLFREDHGLLENDRWQAYLQGTPLSDITGLTSPVGSLNDIERLLFENFAELHNESTGLYLPGTSGNYVSTPDHTDLDSIASFSLIFNFQVLASTYSSVPFLISKQNLTPADRSFGVYIDATGTLKVEVSQDGSAIRLAQYIINWDTLEGNNSFIALTVNNNNGTYSEVHLWKKVVNDWEHIQTQLGNTYTTIFNSSTPLVCGGRFNSGVLGNVAPMNVNYFAMYDGIGDNSAPGLGTLVAEFDASAPVGPRYRDRTGKIWTINGSAWSWE